MDIVEKRISTIKYSPVEKAALESLKRGFDDYCNCVGCSNCSIYSYCDELTEEGISKVFETLLRMEDK